VTGERADLETATGNRFLKALAGAGIGQQRGSIGVGIARISAGSDFDCLASGLGNVVERVFERALREENGKDPNFHLFPPHRGDRLPMMRIIASSGTGRCFGRPARMLQLVVGDDGDLRRRGRGWVEFETDPFIEQLGGQFRTYDARAKGENLAIVRED